MVIIQYNMREEEAAVSAGYDNYINIDRGNGKPASAAADTTNHVLPSTFFMSLIPTQHSNTKENIGTRGDVQTRIDI